MKNRLIILGIVLTITAIFINGCIGNENVDGSKNIITKPIITQTPNATVINNIRELQKIGDNESINSLISYFSDKNEQIQQESMIALMNIGVPAVEPLIEALKSQNSDTRMCAAITLGKIGDKRAIDPVKQLLNDPDERVRIEAQDAYKELTKQNITN